MLNIAEAIKGNPSYFRKLEVKNGLIVNYNCPQMTEWANLYTHLNHFIYTLSGERRIVRPEKTIDARQGSLLFLRKSAFQQGKFHDEAWTVVVFAVDDVYLRSFINEFRERLNLKRSAHAVSRPVLCEVNCSETLDAYFHGLLPYFAQVLPPNDALLELKMKELIFNIFLDGANDELLTAIDEAVTDHNADFIEVMEANFQYNLTLSDLAKLTNRSLTNFKNQFFEIFATTPGKWLIQKRLDLACQKLLASSDPVNEIALDSGFESVTHFNRVFKVKFGISPLKYRERHAR